MTLDEITLLFYGGLLGVGGSIAISLARWLSFYALCAYQYHAIKTRQGKGKLLDAWMVSAVPVLYHYSRGKTTYTHLVYALVRMVYAHQKGRGLSRFEMSITFDKDKNNEDS